MASFAILQHKLLRQKRWHVPVPAQILNPLAPQPLLPKLSSALSLHPPIPSTSSAPPADGDVSMIPNSSSAVVNAPSSAQTQTSHPESALDIEFDNAWETTSDWNEDDEEAADEENFLCFGPSSSESHPPYEGQAVMVPQDVAEPGPPPSSSTSAGPSTGSGTSGNHYQNPITSYGTHPIPAGSGPEPRSPELSAPALQWGAVRRSEQWGLASPVYASGFEQTPTVNKWGRASPSTEWNRASSAYSGSWGWGR